MRRVLRELARGARADAWRAASAPQASAFAHECRGVASLADWRAGAAVARRLQPLLQPRGATHRSLLPPALAVAVQARWNSTPAPPLPPPDVPAAEAAHAGGLLAEAVGGSVGSEVASIAGESNFAIASLQYLVEWFHVSGDLPWWLAIVATTWTLRTMILPLTAMQMRNTAKLTLARPELERINERMKTQLGNPDAQALFQNEMVAVWQKYDCNPVKSFAPLFAQAPLFICFFLAIQRMSVLPSFESGGAAWFMNLAVADPTYMMPLLSGATFLATVELGAVDGMQGNPAANNMKWGMRALAVFLVPFTASFSQGVFVYWISSNTFSFFQAIVFKWQPLRRACGIPDTRHLAPSGQPQRRPIVPPSALLLNKPRAKPRV